MAAIAQQDSKILMDGFTSANLNDLRSAVAFLTRAQYRIHALGLNNIVLNAANPRVAFFQPHYDLLECAAQILDREGQHALAVSVRNMADRFVDLVEHEQEHCLAA
jgi:hypothetical protein